MSRVLPILFNTEMVQAILREVAPKTATRRTIKGYIPKDAIWGYSALTPKGYISCRGTFANGYGEKFFKLPCKKGDILYVRETWAFMSCIGCNGDYARPGSGMNCYDTQAVEYDDGESISDGCFIYRADCKTPERIVWRPSIHMPKKAARIWLKVTDVRVERLGDITIESIRAEGLTSLAVHAGDMDIAIQEWQILWNSTIKKSDLAIYGYEANPWVWVIEFER
ncbi:MAG: hypothetical protein K2K46_01520 [Lachnospiraceae bacterium]|nr:hypothetical protein [Lachnospiraceae bacterium]